MGPRGQVIFRYSESDDPNQSLMLLRALPNQLSCLRLYPYQNRRISQGCHQNYGFSSYALRPWYPCFWIPRLLWNFHRQRPIKGDGSMKDLWYVSIILKLHDANLLLVQVTKRYLVRVCKHWNSMATPYLYESLVLGRSKVLNKLCHALKVSDERGSSSDHVRPFGWWTKRLDVVMRDMSSESIGDELDCLSELVQRLPNLTILTFCATAPQLLRVILPPALLQHLSRSNIQAISWRNNTLTPGTEDWYDFLVNSPQLRAIHFPDVITHCKWSPRLTLPSLRALLVRRQSDVLEAELPSLRQLTIDVAPSTPWDPLLQNHGTNLETMQLCFRFHSLISPTLARLASSCPNLSRLDISVSSWELFGCGVDDCNITIPPTVKTLGIQSMLKQSPKRFYKCLFRGLQDMKISPPLKVVQLIDTGNAADLCLRHQRILAGGLEMLRGRGLELRDTAGFLIQ